MTVLLPIRARRFAMPLLTCCVIFVGAVGAIALRLPAWQRLDTAADTGVQRAVGQHETALHLVAGLGERAEVGTATLVLAVLCLAAHRLNAALLALIAIPVAPGLTEYVLKPLFTRLAHPYGAFPSGHTTAAFAVATVVAVLLATPGGRVPAGWRLAITVIALAAAAAVAVSVIGLGMHTLTDALGGAGVGVGVALSVALLLDLPAARRLVSRRAASLPGSERPVRGSPSGTSGPAR